MRRIRRTVPQRGRTAASLLGALILAVAVVVLPGPAAGEQASEPTNPASGSLTTGHHHTCAVHLSALRCWGFGGNGQLGYGNTTSIGDDETPGSVGPANVGFDRSAIAISAGNVHTCALLDDGTVRCWGFGASGRLGYGNTETIGDDEPPGSVGPVDLGLGRTAKAISAGDGHTCAILDNNTVRCWGYGFDGRLGYNNTENIGDNETPGSAGAVNFGPGLTAKAISAGGAHTCAILSDDTVRCWGFGGAGRLGYGTKSCIIPPPPLTAVQCPVDVGRGCWLINNNCNPDPTAPSPANMGAVNLGPGRTARGISAGQFHTCAVLDDGNVRCWGTGGGGRLGYGNEESIGDNETPDSVGPVSLGRPARAVSAGGDHTCAVLDDGSVRCWGFGAFGQLGYANSDAVGDNEAPSAAGPVDLVGSGRSATAVSTGLYHTCARLDDDSVRCWGYGANGRLGYCNERTIGDDETPTATQPVDVGSASGGAACSSAAGPSPRPRAPSTPAGNDGADPRVAEAARLAGLRDCLARVRLHARRDIRRARRLSGGRRIRARRHARRHGRQLRGRCLKRHGRTPGRVTDLAARATSEGSIVLTFSAPGTDGSRPPAARNYLVKQSRRRISSGRRFRRAPSLCRGNCSFNVTRVGARLSLTVTRVRRGRRYYFAVAARDNVSKRLGRRSRTVSARAHR